jgi:hypothetical protein
MLPQRRIELYLAQIAYLIATTMGGVKGKSLSDFMFDPSDADETADLSVDDVASYFGGIVVRKPAEQ